MRLFICSLLQTIFPSCWLGFLKSIIINYVSNIPYYVFGFIGTLYFGASPERYYCSRCVYVGIQDFGVPPLGLISFGAPLSLCSNDIGFQVTFTLGFSLEKLTHHPCLVLYCMSEEFI